MEVQGTPKKYAPSDNAHIMIRTKKSMHPNLIILTKETNANRPCCMYKMKTCTWSALAPLLGGGSSSSAPLSEGGSFVSALPPFSGGALVFLRPCSGIKRKYNTIYTTHAPTTAALQNKILTYKGQWRSEGPGTCTIEIKSIITTHIIQTSTILPMP